MKDIEAAELIAQKAAELGGTVYYVGGCVRDSILGRDSKDIDIEIHGLTEEQTAALLDGIGERLEYGKSFGIYSLRGLGLDIALPRRSPDTPPEPFMGTYEAARRRDLTMNALMKMNGQNVARDFNEDLMQKIKAKAKGEYTDDLLEMDPENWSPYE